MLHVSLLGEQAITRDGTSVQVRSSRGVALVGFLVVHAGVPQARERIAGLFGPPRQVWRLLCLRTSSEFTRCQCFIVDFLVHFRRHIAAV